MLAKRHWGNARITYANAGWCDHNICIWQRPVFRPPRNDADAGIDRAHARVCVCSCMHGELWSRAAVICLQACTGYVQGAVACMGMLHCCMDMPAWSHQPPKAKVCRICAHRASGSLCQARFMSTNGLGPLSPTTMHQVLEVPCIPTFTLKLTHFWRRHASHTPHTAMLGLQTGHASQHGASCATVAP
jgi:hypothetical protein